MTAEDIKSESSAVVKQRDENETDGVVHDALDHEVNADFGQSQQCAFSGVGCAHTVPKTEHNFSTMPLLEKSLSYVHCLPSSL